MVSDFNDSPVGQTLGVARDAQAVAHVAKSVGSAFGGGGGGGGGGANIGSWSGAT
jgi:hypothetical protein